MDFNESLDNLYESDGWNGMDVYAKAANIVYVVIIVVIVALVVGGGILYLCFK